jgi:hypothetical protein
MIVRLMSKGLFAGEFVATTDDQTFSLGNYLEVTLTAPAYVVGHLDGLDGLGIWAFPLQIDFSAVEQTFQAEIRIVMGRTARHYNDCLKVGHTHTIVSCKCQYRKYVWYAPKIDGQVPGMFGPRKLSA